MKRLLNNLALMALGSAVLFSCKKDETRAVVAAGSNPAIASSVQQATLTKATENANATTFTITPANFGYQAAVTYTAQFAKPGTNFANPFNMQLPAGNLTPAVTGKNLNIAALNAGLDTNSLQDVQVRLKADIGAGQAPVYSAPITIKVKPYSLNAYLWVPGDYQGWNPGGAPRLISVNSTGAYEGYVNFASGNGEFKMTDSPTWNNGIFGDAGNGSSGNLASPGNNFKLTQTGYYKVNANTNTNTWSATRTTWSIIGDGASGWGTDVPMTYNTVDSSWTATTTLNTAGKIKFRANNDWTLNFGDDGANGSLEYGGADIPVTLGGSRTVKLKLNTPGAYRYTIQ